MRCIPFWCPHCTIIQLLQCPTLTLGKEMASISARQANNVQKILSYLCKPPNRLSSLASPQKAWKYPSPTNIFTTISHGCEHGKEIICICFFLFCFAFYNTGTEGLPLYPESNPSSIQFSFVYTRDLQTQARGSKTAPVMSWTSPWPASGFLRVSDPVVQTWLEVLCWDGRILINLINRINCLFLCCGNFRNLSPFTH